MMNHVSIQRVQRIRRMNWQRLTYAASMAFYGAAIVPLIVIANVLSRTPIFKEPERLPLGSEILLGGSAALAGALLVGLVTYWLYGDKSELTASVPRRPLGIPVWVGVGLGYGFLVPLLAGGVFIPFGRLFSAFFQGSIGFVDLLNGSIDSALLSPLRAVTTGAPFLFTSFIAAPFFAIGAWGIDRLNASRNPDFSSYGYWITAIVLGIIAIGLAAFGPPEFLANFG